ncbi:hypothetical protein Zmor_027924 [Zophobas morio]|uniref:Uncharacterized protein n=1 Tax=Zophobas morio TaxID=2755281 RepID=A0AA38HNY8_9CUCU|nr:hypothetical protein Zmor_027924 [Zophobas morio]
MAVNNTQIRELCKFCKNPPVICRVVCQNCKQYAHISCSGFGKQKTNKTCCENQLLIEDSARPPAKGETIESSDEDEEFNDAEESPSESLRSQVRTLQEENSLLREKLRESEENMTLFQNEVIAE